MIGRCKRATVDLAADDLAYPMRLVQQNTRRTEGFYITAHEHNVRVALAEPRKIILKTVCLSRGLPKYSPIATCVYAITTEHVDGTTKPIPGLAGRNTTCVTANPTYRRSTYHLEGMVPVAVGGPILKVAREYSGGVDRGRARAAVDILETEIADLVCDRRRIDSIARRMITDNSNSLH
jgi:hypothetical protein